ncbi:MAG: hypothetical protein ACYS0E_08160 [Planctomycetota bacterium]
MGSRTGALVLLALAACTTLNRAGGPLHVEKGVTLTVREESKRQEVALAWRAFSESRIVLDVVAGDDALPAPLAIAHAAGHSTVSLRFPYDGGGVGLAILGGHTPLVADRATVETIWLPSAGFAWLHPVAQLKLEGPLSLAKWLDPVRVVVEDPAPYRDLLDEIENLEFRYQLARGVERVLRLNFGHDVPSTWELAAVYHGGERARDWQDRSRLALSKGRVDLLEGCTAVIRENAYGARRGKHYHQLPLIQVLLASEVDGTARRWSWSGLAAIAAARPNYDLPPLPEGLPMPSMRVVTLHDRTFRHGPSSFTYGLMSVAGYLGAVLVEYGLQWAPAPDGWTEWWNDWVTGGQGKSRHRRKSRAP